MAQAHYYLVSTLPMLRLGEAPPWTSDQFLDACAEHLAADEMQHLRDVSLVPAGPPCCAVHRRWLAWETYLRNDLVRRRAHHLSEPADPWLREEPDVFPTDRREVDEILNESTPLERERDFDRLRWARLEDFRSGHAFDFDALLAYRLQLLLVERVEQRDATRGREQRDGLVETGVARAMDVRVQR